MAKKQTDIEAAIARLEQSALEASQHISVIAEQIGDINSSLESLLTMCIRLDSGKEKPKRNDNLTIGDTDKRAVSSED
ncbi:MAG: hypothetical protein ACRC6D_06330, partial [Aeromonas sp.]